MDRPHGVESEVSHLIAHHPDQQLVTTAQHMRTLVLHCNTSQLTVHV